MVCHLAQVGKNVLGNYTNYYGIPFPLSKLDLIAIPDYSAGAMEVPLASPFCRFPAVRRLMY
jgi:aminopeptidase N